jgi:hypothetical protein
LILRHPPPIVHGAAAVNPPTEDDLLQLRASHPKAKSSSDLPLLQRTGLLAVRGAEVVEVRDEEGGLMNDFTGRVRWDERKPPKGKSHVTCGNKITML